LRKPCTDENQQLEAANIAFGASQRSPFSSNGQ
jgi:hypothetical protein